MDIPSISRLLASRLNTLNDAKARAVSVGDIEQINLIDKDLLETQNSIQQLQMLSDVSTAALNVNVTPAQVVLSGINAVSNLFQGPSASAIINGYDVSAYATDPLYEQKISRIITNLPLLNVVGDIDTYIQNNAPGSLVTGDMIYRAVTQYNVDLALTIAIIQNDSSFGTAGIGARTFNPGNVGNTGYSERSYPSWFDGVCAVAEWLSRHKVDYVVEPTVVVTNQASVIDAVLPPTTSIVFPNPNDAILPASETVTDIVVEPTEIPTITPTPTPEISPAPILDFRNATTSTSTSNTVNEFISPASATSTEITATSTQAYKRPKNNKIV